MRLSAPKVVVFFTTLAAAITAVAVNYFGANVPYVGSNAFALLLGAYILLSLGTLLRGL